MKKIHLLALALIAMVGCTTKEVQVIVNPGSSTITALGTGAQVLPNESGALVRAPGSASIPLRISAPDHETVTLDLAADDKRKNIQVSLERIRESRNYLISTTPPGAVVIVDGRNLGRSPLTVPIVFERGSSRAPWSESTVILTLEDWESQSFKITRNDPQDLPLKNLQRLRQVVPMEIRARTEGGSAISATVYFGDEIAGTTPLTLQVDFSRARSSDPWPSFEGRIGIQDRYKFRPLSFVRGGQTTFDMVLEPVSELLVPRNFPTVEMTPTGAQVAWDQTALPGAIDTSETQSNVLDLRALTDFDREDPRKALVNSMTITPNGQDLIYGVTMETERGPISNLWQSSAQALTAQRRQLTEGPYLDSNPVMGNLPGSQTVAFQSNRGFRNSMDISSIRLVDNQVLGGIRQLTREQRFNYSPIYRNEEWEIFFVSLEDRFSLARPQISFMSLDGTLPTYLNQHGEDLTMSAQGTEVYFVRTEPSTNKLQIYSIPKEGRPLTQVITRSAFMEANCFNPAISPTGNHMLFVADLDQDELGRNNNNIYLMNLSTGNISAVTQNLSDDLQPMWSPTEPNVLFFISNRGGSYNIWRLELTSLN